MHAGLYCLARLAGGDDGPESSEHRSMIVDQGAVASCVGAMQRFSGSLGVLLAGCVAIGNLARGRRDVGRDRRCDALVTGTGAARMCVSILKDTSIGGGQGAGAARGRLVEASLMALQGLCYDSGANHDAMVSGETRRDAFVDGVGAIQPVLGAMAAHLEDEAVQQRGLLVLMSVLSGGGGSLDRRIDAVLKVRLRDVTGAEPRLALDTGANEAATAAAAHLQTASTEKGSPDGLDTASVLARSSRGPRGTGPGGLAQDAGKGEAADCALLRLAAWAAHRFDSRPQVVSNALGVMAFVCFGVTLSAGEQRRRLVFSAGGVGLAAKVARELALKEPRLAERAVLLLSRVALDSEGRIDAVLAAGGAFRLVSIMAAHREVGLIQ